eukprot:COSAG01_NODE_16742_length_1209_cov_1.208108_1_plen_36_part_10
MSLAKDVEAAGSGLRQGTTWLMQRKITSTDKYMDTP